VIRFLLGTLIGLLIGMLLFSCLVAESGEEAID